MHVGCKLLTRDDAALWQGGVSESYGGGCGVFAGHLFHQAYHDGAQLVAGHRFGVVGAEHVVVNEVVAKCAVDTVLCPYAHIRLRLEGEDKHLVAHQRGLQQALVFNRLQRFQHALFVFSKRSVKAHHLLVGRSEMMHMVVVGYAAVDAALPIHVSAGGVDSDVGLVAGYVLIHVMHGDIFCAGASTEGVRFVVFAFAAYAA